MAGKGGAVQTPEQYAMPRHGKYYDSKVARLRIKLGLTQKQLGDRVGLTFSAISSIERKSVLSIAQAKKVAPALGVDWKDLVE